MKKFIQKRKKEAKIGDIYQLGNHRLMCGDSTNPKDVDKLMQNEMADLVFTDPPYGVSYKGTNHPSPDFKKPCSNGDKCHESAPRGSKTGTQGLKDAKERSVIPEQLCEHIVEICEK